MIRKTSTNIYDPPGHKISHVQLQQFIMYHSETESCTTFSHGGHVLHSTPHPQKYVSQVACFNVSVQVPVLTLKSLN